MDAAPGYRRIPGQGAGQRERRWMWVRWMWMCGGCEVHVDVVSQENACVSIEQPAVHALSPPRIAQSTRSHAVAHRARSVLGLRAAIEQARGSVVEVAPSLLRAETDAEQDIVTACAQRVCRLLPNDIAQPKSSVRLTKDTVRAQSVGSLARRAHGGAKACLVSHAPVASVARCVRGVAGGRA